MCRAFSTSDDARFMTDILWKALAMMLVLEGLLPLLFPGLWRRVMGDLMRLKDGQLRFYGLIGVACGLAFLSWLG